MKLLSTPRELSRTLSGLIRDYDSFYWAVAWASVGFEGYECLKQNSRKARMIVVGTHFYQTHPDFIKQFSGNRAFRYFYDTDAINGVFHPKIFVFTKANGEAAAIVGSANFTGAALGKNVEVCLLIQGEERPSKVLQSLKRYVQNLWNRASPFPSDALAAYREKWERRWSWSASGGVPDKRTKISRNALQVELLKLSWAEIYNKLRQGSYFEERLKMLEQIRMFFHPIVRLSELDLQERQKVAGTFRNEAGIQWRLFGSMQAAIDFKDRIRTNRKEISDALDCIPWDSAVTQSHYQQFTAAVRKAFVYKKPFHGLAVSSRLLAIKRPDYFLCVDRANKNALARLLDIPSSWIQVDSYWGLIQELIDTPWWNSLEPTQKSERAAWLARVAMLDAILYKG